jgi:hypothetical protein
VSRRKVSHPVLCDSSVNWSGTYISADRATPSVRTVLSFGTIQKKAKKRRIAGCSVWIYAIQKSKEIDTSLFRQKEVLYLLIANPAVPRNRN